MHGTSTSLGNLMQSTKQSTDDINALFSDVNLVGLTKNNKENTQN